MKFFLIISYLLVPILVFTQHESIIDFHTSTIHFKNNQANKKKIYKPKDVITVEFIFTNKGKSNLQILDVTSSCSCTVPSYSKSVIQAGRQGKIVLTTTYEQLKLFQKVYAIVKTNTKQKFNKLELHYN